MIRQDQDTAKILFLRTLNPKEAAKAVWAADAGMGESFSKQPWETSQRLNQLNALEMSVQNKLLLGSKYL